MTNKRCADCIHFAPWPERMRFARELMETMPDDYPLWACMLHMATARAVSPYDGTACIYFERGNRDEYVKETCND